MVNVTDWGWSISENNIPCPILDTDVNMKKVDLLRQSIMQKCACKKTGCDPDRKYCKCVINKRVCSVLCKCVGCNNVMPIKPDNRMSKSSDEISSTSSCSENSEDQLTYEAPFAEITFNDSILSDGENAFYN